MTLNQSEDEFRKAWRSVWPKDQAEDTHISRRFQKLLTMKEIKPNDIIVIPKVSIKSKKVGQFFTVARCVESYHFDPTYINSGKYDCGHIIPIKPLFSCTYDYNAISRTISEKLRAYQHHVNRVYDDEFQIAVASMLQQPPEFSKEDSNSIQALSENVQHSKKEFMQRIVATINNWQPMQLQKVIEELFNKNGYTLIAQKRYDRKGGDIELIFECFNANSLMGDIYGIANGQGAPEIRIQAKKKTDMDPNDIEGIEQLTKMSGHETAINILINMTPEFSPEAKEFAARRGVILINGLEFASLIIKYGMEVIS